MKLEKIFNRFYKGENSLNPTSIGIGLSIYALNNRTNITALLQVGNHV